MPASTTSADECGHTRGRDRSRDAPRPPPRRSGTCDADEHRPDRARRGRARPARRPSSRTPSSAARSASTASSPIPIAYARRPARCEGSSAVGDHEEEEDEDLRREDEARQNSQPVIGPRCQRAVISWPLAASTASPPAKASQKPTAISSSFSRREDREAADGDDHEREHERHATSAPTRSRADRHARGRATGNRGRARSSTG